MCSESMENGRSLFHGFQEPGTETSNILLQLNSIVSSSSEIKSESNLPPELVTSASAGLAQPKATKYWNPPWWNRRTRLERYLCLLSAISLLLCIILTVSLVTLNNVDSHKSSNMIVGANPTAQHLVNSERAANRLGKANNKALSALETNEIADNKLTSEESSKMLRHGNVCLTPGCVRAASEILRNMNESVSPCDDFYHFACGGWLKEQMIPEDRTTVSRFTLIQDELNHKLRLLVEANDKSQPDEGTIFGQMRSFYKSCMNLSSIERNGETQMQLTLKSLGGWPIIVGDSWDRAGFDFVDMLIKFRKIGYTHDIIFDLSVTPDYRNNTKHVIDLDEGSLGMPDRNYLLRGLNDTAVAAYFKLMVDSATMLGASQKQAEKEMRQVLEFETTLARHCLPREEKRNVSTLYNKMKLHDVEKLAPNLDWKKYFNTLLGQAITAEDDIIVSGPKYLKNMDELLLKTDKRLLANYLLWRIVLQSMGISSKRWRNLLLDYSKAITGQAREEPRWEQCISSVSGSLPYALSSLYVQNHFNGQSKTRAEEMVSFIHREFMDILNNIEWMDAKTKQRAKDKAMSIQTFIGYPDELMNVSKIEEFYKDLHFDPDNYFNNMMRLRKWATDYSFGMLRKPNVKGDWRKHARAAVVNAYYNIIENSIEFPAGILQGVFFSADRPSYLNYGAIGFVIGHEITHGFDDKGRQFDKDGNIVNWWEDETDRQFRERAQCIINQYGNYTFPDNGLKLNGINTQGENIADNGGIKEAFRAYKAFERKNGVEPKLPGLDYTPDQLFWISAANVWCGKSRPESLKLRIQIGSHSPGQFRVIGTMSNVEEFAHSFNCAVGSPMRPSKKCSVW